MLVVGPNGVGKTNLLESLHVATQGFSPRTRQDAQLIRFGETAGRIAVDGTRDALRLELSVTLRQGQAKEARLNGARLPSAESLRREVATLVFTPDRLAVVKGGPAARRAYFDRVLGRLFPARAGMPQDYAATLAQRNAALRRVHFGLAPARVARAVDGAHRRACRGARRRNGARRSRRSHRPSRSAPTSSGCRLRDSATTRRRRPRRTSKRASRATSSAVRPGSGRTSTTCWSRAATATCASTARRASSGFAVLSLLLAEAELLPTPPLLLLDDVLSELDLGRRRVLAERVAGMGQTMITATHASALPIEPAQLVEVEHGSAR